MNINKQILSHDQMLSLRELGLDTSDASLVKLFISESDCCPVGYYFVGEDEKGLYTIKTNDGERIGVYVEYHDAESDSYDHYEREENAVYTVTDIIDHLPETIESEGVEYHLTISKKRVAYCSDENKILYASMYDSLLESAYYALIAFLQFIRSKEEKK